VTTRSPGRIAETNNTSVRASVRACADHHTSACTFIYISIGFND
jgi:hypothetical protein